MGRDWLAGAWNADRYLNSSSACNNIVPLPEDSSLDTTNINELELWPVFIGLQKWEPLLQDKAAVLYSDNTQVVALLSK